MSISVSVMGSVDVRSSRRPQTSLPVRALIRSRQARTTCLPGRWLAMLVAVRRAWTTFAKRVSSGLGAFGKTREHSSSVSSPERSLWVLGGSSVVPPRSLALHLKTS